jgi:hypothetical protein
MCLQGDITALATAFSGCKEATSLARDGNESIGSNRHVPGPSAAANQFSWPQISRTATAGDASPAG